MPDHSLTEMCPSHEQNIVGPIMIVNAVAVCQSYFWLGFSGSTNTQGLTVTYRTKKPSTPCNQHEAANEAAADSFPSLCIKDNVAVISDEGLSEGDTSEVGLTQPLLLSLETTEKVQDEEGDQEMDCSEESSEDSRKPANSFFEAYSLLTPPVKVQLLIYFMLKYAMEILLSESSIVTSYYFNWTTSSVAIFLALLGLTVLPVNIVVGNYISNMFEDRQILFAAEVFTCLGVLISFNVIFPYSVGQYVSGAFITFVSAEVLEVILLEYSGSMVFYFRAIIQENVIKVSTGNLQWWPTINRSWNTGSCSGRCDHYIGRLLGAESPTECNTSAFTAHWSCFHPGNLLHLQLALLTILYSDFQ
eukprot:Gb_27487 [translate_table: standard]